ncbi:MAG: response regulator [Burkholderiaceae bacterium]|nr:response regulator [Burkholderiaceae bacterium]
MISAISNAKSSEKVVNILHLEDSQLDHQLVVRILSKAETHFNLVRIDNLSKFKRAMAEETYELVIADYRLGDFTAMDAWNCLADSRRDTPFIILSGTIGEAAAVEAIRSGISDYLHKDEITALPRVIQRTLDVQAIKTAKGKADQELALSEQRISELAGHLQTAIERERTAIAREVHDDIGGALAAVRLDLGWLARHTTDAQYLQHIASASDMVQHAAQASQRIMKNLRPAILDQGLVPAIQWLAREFERRTGNTVEVTAAAETMTVPTDIMLTAYRTAQEALTNASKHAIGSDLRIDISDLGSTLTVEVADSGPGMEQSALQKPNSYGLRGLAERAKAVGGWLDVSSTLRKGTTITLSVPLNVAPPPTGASEP